MKKYRLRKDFYYERTGWYEGEILIQQGNSYYPEKKRGLPMDYAEFDGSMVECNPDIFEKVGDIDKELENIWYRQFEPDINEIKDYIEEERLKSFKAGFNEALKESNNQNAKGI